MPEQINYTGKSVVITGSATGIGEALTQKLIALGAQVHALDIKPVTASVAASYQVDFNSKASIDAALAKLPSSIDAVFCCAGIAGETYAGKSFAYLDIMTINTISVIYFVNALVPRMPENSAISIIASTGGAGWMANTGSLEQLINAGSFEDMQEWVRKNIDSIAKSYPEGTVQPIYLYSKEALIYWMKRNCHSLSKNKIRLNTVSPGNTKTPMSTDFNTMAGFDLAKSAYISYIGRPAEPGEPADAMIFLNSDMAGYISGVDIAVDYATIANFTTMPSQT